MWLVEKVFFMVNRFCDEKRNETLMRNALCVRVSGFDLKVFGFSWYLLLPIPTG